MKTKDYLTYEPPEADKNYIDKAVTRYILASGYWQPWIEWCRDLLRDYDMELDLMRDSDGNILYPYASRVFTPFSFEQIEILIPLIVSMVLDHDPPFTAVPGRPGQDPKLVKKTEDLLTYQLRNRGFKGDAIHAIQQIAKIGSQIFRLKWRYDSEIVEERITQEYLGMPINEYIEKKEVINYDGPDFVRVPFFRFFIDPNTPPCDLQKAQYLIEEDILPWNDFLDDANYLKYENIEYIKAQIDNPQTPKPEGPSTGAGREKAARDERSLSTDEYSRDVRLLYYYDREDVIFVAMVPGSQTSGVLMKRWEFKKKCKRGKYPYHAWYNRIHTDKGAEAGRDAMADNRPGGFYPPGDLAPLHGLQAAHNTTVNQRIDNVTVGLRNPLIIRSGGLEDEELLADGWIQNPVLHARSDSNLKLQDIIYQIKFMDMFGASWAQQTEKIEQWGTRALGTHDAVAGEEDPKNRTATGIMQLTANAMKRIMLKVFILTKMGIGPMLTGMSDMNKDTISPMTLYYVTGDPGKKYINSGEVVRGVEYSIRTVPPYSKQLMANEALQAIPVVAKTYPFASAKRLIEIYLENLEWIENAEEIIPEDAPDINFLQLKQLFASAMMPEIPLGKTGGGSVRKGAGPEMDSEAEVRSQARNFIPF